MDVICDIFNYCQFNDPDLNRITFFFVSILFLLFPHERSLTFTSLCHNLWLYQKVIQINLFKAQKCSVTVPWFWYSSCSIVCLFIYITDYFLCYPSQLIGKYSLSVIDFSPFSAAFILFRTGIFLWCCLGWKWQLFKADI